MMAWTDRHARYFLRLISQRALLYTEMVPLNGLLHGEPPRFLTFDPFEHPVALQIGGADPEKLAQAAKISEQWGYDEINLNVGCPSDRVSSGHFGACLMAEPELVAECISAMVEASSLPVTVKCRIGIDDMDTGETLDRFIAGIIASGCNTIIVHARKAWLKGLSTKENRDIPPLDYDRVYALKRSFQNASIILNGGIKTLDESLDHLEHVDGVMLGRAAYELPYLLADVDETLFKSTSPATTKFEIVERFVPYCDAELENGTPLHRMTRHILGLFHGCPGARRWRQHLSTHASRDNATTEIIYEALQFVLNDRKAA